MTHPPGSLDPSADVQALEPDQRSAAVDALARGFDQEPAKAALVPEAGLRHVVLTLSVANQLDAPLRYGTAYAALVDGEIAAVAVWLPPGVPKISAGGVGRALRALLSNATAVARLAPRVISVLLGDVRGGFALMRERRRAVIEASQGRAWHLALLATLPEHRGQGIARLLLERQLRRCDDDGAAAWLETTDPVNPAVYERFGFAVVSHINGPSWLPGLWVMRRPPIARSNASRARR